MDERVLGMEEVELLSGPSRELIPHATRARAHTHPPAADARAHAQMTALAHTPTHTVRTDNRWRTRQPG